MRLLDLFSGIGGFSLGLECAGFQTVAFCEVNPVCRHLLNHHWPEVPCYDDVQTLTADRLRSDGVDVDAICGGFPCQDISLAGRGAGIAGARSGLWSHYARLIRELRPRLVFVENVAALLGRGMGVVLGDLAALGYDAWWDCIPAAAVGAPHRRDRLWIVAYARGQQHEGYGDALRWAIAARLSRAPADAAPVLGSEVVRNEPHRATTSRRPLADASREGLPYYQRGGEGSKRYRNRAANRSGGFSREHYGWGAEPNVGRVAHGIPRRVDRLHGLGNAVVPQIPEILGRAALAALTRPPHPTR